MQKITSLLFETTETTNFVLLSPPCLDPWLVFALELMCMCTPIEAAAASKSDANGDRRKRPAAAPRE
jgi:hypothetical protein